MDLSPPTNFRSGLSFCQTGLSSDVLQFNGGHGARLITWTISGLAPSRTDRDFFYFLFLA